MSDVNRGCKEPRLLKDRSLPPVEYRSWSSSKVTCDSTPFPRLRCRFRWDNEDLEIEQQRGACLLELQKLNDHLRGFLRPHYPMPKCVLCTGSKARSSDSAVIAPGWRRSPSFAPQVVTDAVGCKHYSSSPTEQSIALQPRQRSATPTCKVTRASKLAQGSTFKNSLPLMP